MHTIRAYGGLEIKLHTSLTSALNGGEGFSSPPPNCFMPEKRASSTH